MAKASISLPDELKTRLDELAKFPYGSLSNAAVVLLTLGLEKIERENVGINEILKALDRLDVDELAQIIEAAAQKIQLLQEK